MNFAFRIITLVFVSGCLALTLPQTVAAFNITPVALDFEVEKRELMQRDITLTNDSSPKRVYAMVNEIDVDENGEIKAFEYAMNEEREDSVTSWLEITRGQIRLEPNEVKTIPLTIRVHPKAKSGIYHAFVGFAAASNKDQARQQIMSGRARGVIVRIAVDQERAEFLKLENFAIDRFVTDPQEEVLRYTVANPGKAEMAPRGEIIFYNTKGVEVGSIPINSENVVLTPNESFTFTSAIPDDFKAGRFKAFMSLEYGTDQLAALTDTTFFYVMPLSTMLIIFGGVLLFAILLTVLMYRRTRPVDPDSPAQVSMYIREGTSDAQDHDIDLKNPTNT